MSRIANLVRINSDLVGLIFNRSALNEIENFLELIRIRSNTDFGLVRKCTKSLFHKKKKKKNVRRVIKTPKIPFSKLFSVQNKFLKMYSHISQVGARIRGVRLMTESNYFITLLKSKGC